MGSMPAGRFVRLVERLWHYPGAIQARVVEQHSEPGETGRAADDAELADLGDVMEM